VSAVSAVSAPTCQTCLRSNGDLVVTDEDPLADIGVLAESRLAAVVQDGQVVDGGAAVR